jgi:DNA-binding LytR/AlgR family response regulator
VDPPLPDCLVRLPAAVGRDLVALSSDLHYLHVHTTRGRAMILGNLGEAAAALGGRGMRVHRSHWVAHEHVQHVQIAGNKAWCLMSTGLRVPVSRRKRRETRAQYGQGPVAIELSRRGVA